MVYVFSQYYLNVLFCIWDASFDVSCHNHYAASNVAFLVTSCRQAGFFSYGDLVYVNLLYTFSASNNIKIEVFRSQGQNCESRFHCAVLSDLEWCDVIAICMVGFQAPPLTTAACSLSDFDGHIKAHWSRGRSRYPCWSKISWSHSSAPYNTRRPKT